MIIAYLSDDKRGPTPQRQRDKIAANGISPDKEFIGDELEMMGLVLRPEADDVLVIAHHRAFVGPKLSGFVLDMLARADATLHLAGEGDFNPQDDDDRARFLAMSAKRWKPKGQMRKGVRAGGRGRPTEFRAPTGSEVQTLKHMWWRKKTKADPDGYSLEMILEVATEMLGYAVQRHHMQYWISPTRQKPDDGMPRIERRQKGLE